jgi:hypothetical protein
MIGMTGTGRVLSHASATCASGRPVSRLTASRAVTMRSVRSCSGISSRIHGSANRVPAAIPYLCFPDSMPPESAPHAVTVSPSALAIGTSSRSKGAARGRALERKSAARRRSKPAPRRPHGGTSAPLVVALAASVAHVGASG